MLIFPGPRALSLFRLSKLKAVLAAKAVPVNSISAEFVHFVHCSNQLSEAGHTLLKQLLEYGSTGNKDYEKITEPDISFVVVPRPGTISPWSSKATNIIHNVGLHEIKRLERGIFYQFSCTTLSQQQRVLVTSAIHDRMTETVLTSAEAANCLFRQHDPRLQKEVDIIDGWPRSTGARQYSSGTRFGK